MQLNHEDSLENLFCDQPEDCLSEKVTTKLSLKERKAARRARQLVGKNKGRWAI
jgi:hypothetical protein